MKINEILDSNIPVKQIPNTDGSHTQYEFEVDGVEYTVSFFEELTGFEFTFQMKSTLGVGNPEKTMLQKVLRKSARAEVKPDRFSLTNNNTPMTVFSGVISAVRAFMSGRRPMSVYILLTGDLKQREGVYTKILKKMEPVGYQFGAMGNGGEGRLLGYFRK